MFYSRVERVNLVVRKLDISAVSLVYDHVVAVVAKCLECLPVGLHSNQILHEGRTFKILTYILRLSQPKMVTRIVKVGSETLSISFTEC